MSMPGVVELLDKAKQSLAAAERLLVDGFHDFAASRSYYAMFYATEALLLSQDISFSKHSAVIAAFGKRFVKTGIFEPRFHRYLLDAFDLRNLGDYGAIHAVEEINARQVLENAQAFCAAIRDYLKSEF